VPSGRQRWPATQALAPQVQRPRLHWKVPAGAPPSHEASFVQAQRLDVQAKPGAQAWPQAPQLWASLVRSWQPSGVWQHDCPAEHAAPPKQVQTSPVAPSVPLGSWHASPGWQVAPSQTQSPRPVHEGEVWPPYSHSRKLEQPQTFWTPRPWSHAWSVSSMALAHVLPQPPQSSELAVVLVSQPSSVAGAAGVAQLPEPRTHVDVQRPAEQISAATLALEQARLQAPQLSTSAPVLVSHPLLASPSQSVQPVSHAPIAHAPAWQTAVACGSAHGAHAAAAHPCAGSSGAQLPPQSLVVGPHVTLPPVPAALPPVPAAPPVPAPPDPDTLALPVPPVPPVLPVLPELLAPPPPEPWELLLPLLVEDPVVTLVPAEPHAPAHAATEAAARRVAQDSLFMGGIIAWLPPGRDGARRSSRARRAKAPRFAMPGLTMPIPGTPESPLRVTVFPTRPEAILIVVADDAKGELSLPPLAAPFESQAVAASLSAAGVLARLIEGTPGRWSEAIRKAASDAKAERKNREKTILALQATLYRGSADPLLRDRGELTEQKMRIDEEIRLLKKQISDAHAEARAHGTYMDRKQFRDIQARADSLGFESQALQARLGELKRQEKARNREASRIEQDRFERRFIAAARDMLEPDTFDQIMAAALDDEDEEGAGEG
jgi:hypothetical protein